MKRLIPYAISIGFWATVLPLLSMAVQYTYFSFVPQTSFFEYESVSPIQERYTQDQELVMLSTAEFKKPVNVRWNDRLFCDCSVGKECKEGVYTLQSSFLSESVKKEPTKYKSTTWIWEGRRPQGKSSCYIETNITIFLPFGIRKTQILNTEVFVLDNF